MPLGRGDAIEIAMDAPGRGLGLQRRLDADVRDERVVRDLVAPWGELLVLGFYGHGRGSGAYVVELDEAESEYPMREALERAGVVIGRR